MRWAGKHVAMRAKVLARHLKRSLQTTHNELQIRIEEKSVLRIRKRRRGEHRGKRILTL
jgi:hypothetical protein